VGCKVIGISLWQRLNSFVCFYSYMDWVPWRTSKRQTPERQTPERQTPEKQTPEKQTSERQNPEIQSPERSKKQFQIKYL